MILQQLFDLSSHGADTFVGTGPSYPWGGLYGGHIVAQGLRAAALTVDDAMLPHSLRAYFIRRGDHTEPVRYEVDRIRNGRSFGTRRVIARQAIGAILNLEASFQRSEPALDLSPVQAPTGIVRPDGLTNLSWSTALERRFVPAEATPPPLVGNGRVLCWFKVTEDLGDDELLHRCALAYISDDLPADSVVRSHPNMRDTPDDPDGVETPRYIASLDHAVWFHRPVRVDEWHLYDFACHSYTGGRGLSVGHVFDQGGRHVATVAQEVLVREVTPTREPTPSQGSSG